MQSKNYEYTSNKKFEKIPKRDNSKNRGNASSGDFAADRYRQYDRKKEKLRYLQEIGEEKNLKIENITKKIRDTIEEGFRFISNNYSKLSSLNYQKCHREITNLAIFHMEVNTLAHWLSTDLQARFGTEDYMKGAIEMYETLEENINKKYTSNKLVEIFWKCLNEHDTLPTSTSGILKDCYLSDVPMAPLDTEGSAASAIRKKGWNIVPFTENDAIFELIATKTSDKLTSKEIDAFYQEKLKTKLKNATRKGLEKLIKNGAAPLDLLEKAKNALDGSQDSDIFHWNQLKNINYWYLEKPPENTFSTTQRNQDSLSPTSTFQTDSENTPTNTVYIGAAINHNSYGIEKDVIAKLKSKQKTTLYSKKLNAYLIPGDESINKTNNIFISVDYLFPSVSKDRSKLHVIITDKNEIFITDRIRQLSHEKYNGDESFIKNKKSNKDPNWAFYETDLQ